MKRRDDMQTKNSLTSEQKWAIGTGIFLGLPLGKRVGLLNMLAISWSYFQTGNPPGNSWVKASVRLQQGGALNTLQALKCRHFSVPVVATAAICASIGFFGRKTYSALKKSHENEKNKLTYKNS